MLKFANLVEQNMEELARLETMAIGKPLSVLLQVDIPHMIGCYKCMFLIRTWVNVLEDAYNRLRLCWLGR